MQDHPTAQALLEAVARFLSEDIRPALADPALEFRTLIAAHLASIVSRELAFGSAQDAAERTRLVALLAPMPPTETAALNTALTAKLRTDALELDELERIYAHLLETLRERLQIVNPRFDPKSEIE